MKQYLLSLLATVLYISNAQSHGFVAGTLVKTPTGYCPIELLHIGDEVVCLDNENHLVIEKIKNAYSHTTTTLIALEFDSELIISDHDHQFYLRDEHRWEESYSLTVTHRVQSGEFGYVTPKYLHLHTNPTQVFNLTINKHHTFFVSKADVLVHNLLPAIGIVASWAFGAGTIEFTGLGLWAAIGTALFGIQAYKNHKNKSWKTNFKGHIDYNVNGGNPQDPDENELEKWWKIKKRALTNKEARNLAERLGFQEVHNPPFNSHGELVFRKNNTFISPDNTGHQGGIWKVLDKAGKRLGTYNWNISRRLGN